MDQTWLPDALILWRFPWHLYKVVWSLEENINWVKFTKITSGHGLGDVSRTKAAVGHDLEKEKLESLPYDVSSLDVPFPLKLTNTKTHILSLFFFFFFSFFYPLYFRWHFMFKWHHFGVPPSRNVAGLWNYLQPAN